MGVGVHGPCVVGPLGVIGAVVEVPRRDGTRGANHAQPAVRIVQALCSDVLNQLLDQGTEGLAFIEVDKSDVAETSNLLYLPLVVPALEVDRAPIREYKRELLLI